MLGLYLHIPFCSKKCYYCDFASYVNMDYLVDDYIKCVLSELSLYEGKKFDTIFIGGGTPSYLNSKQLDSLLCGINKSVNVDDVLEFTVECNPGTLDQEKLRVMKNYGVNRLSIGLQSANEQTLRFIGRIHSLNDFDKSINYAFNAGISNINADIIFGIPNENLQNYESTLNEIVKYDLSHISAYSLILEENTKFYNMYLKGEFEELEEDIQVQMYKRTKEVLQNYGFNQYEISNYSKSGKECLHNLVYWNFDEYVGVGVSAHSFYNNKRYYNTRNVKKYIEIINSGAPIYEEVIENTRNDNIEEYIMVGFRKIKGINCQDFIKRFGVNIFDLFGEIINLHIKNKLLVLHRENLFLSDTGLMLMNYVLKDFIKELK